MHLFEQILSVSGEELSLTLSGIQSLQWSDFLLNPRRLRGSDFLMRWSQGVWSERRLKAAINELSDLFYVISYGPSSVAPQDDIRAFELYFERLEQAGLGRTKRPDLLLFKKEDKAVVDEIIIKLGGEEELPFVEEGLLSDLLTLAIMGIECENSLWIAEKMPSYGEALRPMRRLGGKKGLPKHAVLPTIILKEEDREPLFFWQNEHEIPIHIWHVFFDKAFGLSLNEAQRLIDEGLILPTEQVFQAPGGATTRKLLYKFYYHYAYPLAVTVEDPKLIADYIEDKNGHILPYVRFEGGRLSILPEAVDLLQKIKSDDKEDG